MALDFKDVDVPFTGGIDSKTADQLLQGPKIDDLQNMRFRKSGAIERRPDYRYIGSPGSETDKILEHGGTLVAIGTGESKQLTDEDGETFTWKPLLTSGPRSMDIERRPVIRGEEDLQLSLSSVHGGYVAHIFMPEDERLWLRIDDIDSGATMHGPVRLPSFTILNADPTNNGAEIRNASFQIHPLTIGGVTSWAILGLAQDFSVNVNTSVMIVQVASGVVTVGAAHFLTGIQASGSLGFSDPASSRLHVVATQSAPKMHELAFAGLGAPAVTTCAMTGADSFLGGFVNPVSGYMHGYGYDDDIGPGIRYWQATIGAFPASVASANLFTPSPSDPFATGIAVGAHRSNGTAIAIYEGIAGSGPPALSQAGVKWIELNAAGAPVLESGRVAWQARLHAFPWADEEDRILVPMVSSYYWRSEGLPMRDSRQHAFLGQIDTPANDRMKRVAAYQLDVARRAYATVTPVTYSNINRTGRARPSSGPWGFGSVTNEIVPTGQASFPYMGNTQSAYMLFTLGAPTAIERANRVTLMSGGYLSQIDGQRHAEVMQAQPPAVIEWEFHSLGPTMAADGTFGSGATGTLYDFHNRWVWAWRDAQGNIHRSASSRVWVDPRTRSVGENTGGPFEGGSDRHYEYRIAVPPFLDAANHGEYPTDVWLECYQAAVPSYPPASGAATASAKDLPGLIGYSINNATPLGSDPDYRAEIHFPLYDIIDPDYPWQTVPLLPGSFASQQFYGNPIGRGPYQHDPTPSPHHMTSTRDRVWIIDAENRGTVWYSAASLPGEAPEFSAIRTMRLPNEAGDLVALSAIGDLVVFFGESSVHTLEAIGGPDRTGAGSFAPVRRISSEIGCVNRDSVVVTDIGVFFQSSHGISMYSGGQSIDREIGLSVQHYLNTKIRQGERIVSSCIMSRDSQVMFDLSDGSTMVFDYEHRAWGIFDVLYDFAGTSIVTTSATLGDDHVVVDSNGSAYVSDEDPFDEAVGCSFTTGWLRLAGIQGYKRVRKISVLGRMGHAELPLITEVPLYFGTITLKVYYNDDIEDFDEYPIRDVLRTNLDPFQMKWHLTQRQKFMSLKIEILYTPPDAQGGGQPFRLKPLFSGLALDVGVHPGIHRISQTRGL